MSQKSSITDHNKEHRRLRVSWTSKGLKAGQRGVGAGVAEGVTSATWGKREEVTGTIYSRSPHINQMDNLPLFSNTTTIPHSCKM